MTEPKFRFEHLQVTDRVARFTFYQLPHEPYLDLVHAGETNKRFFNALLKRSRKNVRRMRAGAVDGATLALNRNEDRGLYPKHVVKGWGSKRGPSIVVDHDGNEFDFTEPNVYAFLKALPDWLFDDCRLFASEEANFLDEDDGEVPDPEAVAGN